MSYQQLTAEERYQIYALRQAGHSRSEIAVLLNRHASTIGRELKRNCGLRGYRPQQAQRLSEERRCAAFKHRKVTPEVMNWIETLLAADLSPEQVYGYLAQDQRLQLSHETVYRLVYEDWAAGGHWYLKLRHVPKGYRKRYASDQRRGQIINRVSIDERPSIVDHKSRLGDWEGDTIIGKGHQSALLSLVERKSLYTILVKLCGRNASDLADKLIAATEHLKDWLLTLTLDNGKEFAAHERIAESLELKVYFAHPYSSWERGINENTNGLVRQYFPKGTDFNQVADQEIQAVADKLNLRPRKTRGYQSPNQLFLRQTDDLLAA